MANKPIAMSKLRRVLKLYCQGQSKLQISTLTGLSRNTVKKYIQAFQALRTTWEDVNQLSDKDLDAMFCQEPEPTSKASSEKIVRQTISTCCFPNNDASLCCSPYPSVSDNTGHVQPRDNFAGSDM